MYVFFSVTELKKKKSLIFNFIMRIAHHQNNDIQITSSSNGRRQSGSAVRAGENFTLSCDIRGNTMSDVTWLKYGSLFESKAWGKKFIKIILYFFNTYVETTKKLNPTTE